MCIRYVNCIVLSFTHIAYVRCSYKLKTNISHLAKRFINYYRLNLDILKKKQRHTQTDCNMFGKLHAGTEARKCLRCVLKSSGHPWKFQVNFKRLFQKMNQGTLKDNNFHAHEHVIQKSGKNVSGAFQRKSNSIIIHGFT